MKKAFHAPALAEVKPSRAPIEGRPAGTVPTFRIPAERKGPKFLSMAEAKRLVDKGHKFFFSKRPELHMPTS